KVVWISSAVSGRCRRCRLRVPDDIRRRYGWMSPRWFAMRYRIDLLTDRLLICQNTDVGCHDRRSWFQGLRWKPATLCHMGGCRGGKSGSEACAAPLVTGRRVRVLDLLVLLSHLNSLSRQTGPAPFLIDSGVVNSSA